MPYFLKRPAIKTDTITVYHDDCRRTLKGMGSATVDCVITDPPYPHIKREYGTWTEENWFKMMRVVVPECMRISKPTGSAVFILQPNSHKCGKMRTWLWEFLVWVGKEWGVVQDAYWWNYTVLPAGHAIQGRLMRPSVKTCVWVGSPDCWRDQDGVLWSESQRNVAMRSGERVLKKEMKPSGHGVDRVRCGEAAVKRGGVTPFNLLPFANANSMSSAGAHGHGAGTPTNLMRWWTRYICPAGGTVLDPFLGSGTAALAAHAEGRKCIGIETKEEYVQICKKRINQPEGVSCG